VIITRKQALEAAAVFGFDLASGALDAQQVTAAYKTQAKLVHPDVGGSAEAFAAVDRAKHVLLHWLARQEEPQASAAPALRTCPPCGGRGFVISQRAFRQMRVQCPTCRGTGDLDYEHEKEGSEL
jgi:DnaJ-class molecular chaperone